MQVAPSGGQFVTDASGATWWLLEPMQVAFFLLAGEITQVKEAIPWVRCASGNVFNLSPKMVIFWCHFRFQKMLKTLPEAQRTQGIESLT